MNTLMKVAGAGIALFVIAKIVSAKEAGVGNIVATNLNVDKITCTQLPCTVSGSVTWKNEGTEAASFIPKLVSGTGSVLASHPVQTLQKGEEYTMPFSVQITKDTQLCPVPN